MRSFVTTTRTSVSYGDGCPGLGDCWIRVSTVASRHTGSSNLPSRVIETEESTTARALCALGSARPVAVAPSKKRIDAPQARLCGSQAIEPRALRDGPCTVQKWVADAANRYC